MSRNCLLIFLVSIASLFYGFESSDIVYDDCEQPLSSTDCSVSVGAGAGKAKNVILMIGDGMGINQTVAARVFLNGPEKPLDFETLPERGMISSCSLSGVTDSAAAGTALATGHKTYNGRVSVGPDGRSLESVLEKVKSKKATGLVSTCCIWDATPAVFAAHNLERHQSREIVQNFLITLPDVMLGGGRSAWTGGLRDKNLINDAISAGYTYVKNSAELNALDLDKTDRLLGLFSEGNMTYEASRKTGCAEPRLHEMTDAALGILGRDPRGFFLLVEGGTIDHACHRMSLKKMTAEVIEFNETVKLVLEWMKDNPDTLVIVTADHETGGIKIMPGSYEKGDRVDVKWTTEVLPLLSSHSSQRVPIYAVGPNSEAVKEYQDNTAVHCIIMNAFDTNNALVP